MTELVLTRGLPGSGKSTWAKNWVMEDLAHRARVERDQIRNMLHFGEWRGKDTEDQVVIAQAGIVGGLLIEGISVVISDTNLPGDLVKRWERHAINMGVDFRVQDFRQVPLETVLRQNAQRTGKEFIPKHVILDMHSKFVVGLPEIKPLTQPDFSSMTERERFEYRFPDFEG